MIFVVMGLKLDILKGDGMIEWSFLKAVLNGMNFHR